MNPRDETPLWHYVTAIALTSVVVLWIGVGFITGNDVVEPRYQPATPAVSQQPGRTTTSTTTGRSDLEDLAAAAAVALFTGDWSDVPYLDVPPEPRYTWPNPQVTSIEPVDGDDSDTARSWLVSVDPDGMGGPEGERIVTVKFVLDPDTGQWRYTFTQ